MNEFSTFQSKLKNTLPLIRRPRKSEKMFMKVLLVSCSMLILSEGIILMCEYSIKTHLHVRDVYTCEASVFHVGGPIVTNVSTDNHLPGYGNDDVKGLVFVEAFNFTPHGVGAFFPNIEAFTFEGTNINSELTKDSLRGLNQLRLLNFGKNNLSLIEADLFLDNSLLEAIYFDSNPIKHVAHHAFDHLYRLDTLFLYNTTCINTFASNSRDGVIDLTFRLIANCPATFEMTEAKILNGSLFQSKLDSQISSAVEPLNNKIHEIEERQRDLEQRIKALEATIP